MRLLHIADLHIGKRIYERSLLEDQQYMLEQLLLMIQEECVDGVLIAGDIYDKSIPLERGILLFDDFLTTLHKRGIMVCLISGNHDSGERLKFGARIMEDRGVHMAGTCQGEAERIMVQDEFGPLYIYLLPFIKPGMVRPYYENVETYDEAVKAVIENTEIDPSRRNILVSHQFVTYAGTTPDTCDSETTSIGGIDNVDAGALQVFDYVALGHLHGPQRIGSDQIRYAGSLLPYSFSEVRHKKSAVLIDLKEKGNVSFRLLPLVPLRRMREIKGPLEELLKKENYEQGSAEDYLRVILTNEEPLFSPLDAIRAVYPNVLRLDFENSRTRHNPDMKLQASQMKDKSPLELLDEFYEKQNNQPLDESQKQLLESILRGRRV